VADFARNANGEIDDRVRLTLAGHDVRVAESYDVRCSYLTAPGNFALRLGSGDVASELIALGFPNTKFQLQIGGVPAMSGAVDGFEAEGSTGGTEVTIHGRDVLAPLFDNYVDAETSFSDETYVALVGKIMNRVADVAGKTLLTDNAANRKIMTGVPVFATSGSEPRTALEIVEDAGTHGTVTKVIQAKLGEKWYACMRRHLDRAGLFFTASADGNFVLSRPNTTQGAVARIVRKRGKNPGEHRSNVLRARWRLDTTHRFTDVAIYTRGRGRKFGRGKELGLYVDKGMENWGFKRTLVLRDKTCTNAAQAEFLAHRHIAEANRQGFMLEYQMRGHTAVSLIDGSRAVWAPDTIVQVEDEEFGISGLFWVESVTFRRPPSTTTLTLMRPGDLVFGGDDDGGTSAGGAAPVVPHALGRTTTTKDTRDELDVLGIRPFTIGQP
jgi:prophage tail gpP-like protein